MPRRRRAEGFTLLELTIVTFIIGLMAMFLMLSIGTRPLDDRSMQEARRFAQMLAIGEDRAQTNGQQVGVVFSDHEYAFMAFDHDRGWTLLSDKPLNMRSLMAPVRVSLRVEGHGNASLPAEAAPRIGDDGRPRQPQDTGDRVHPQILLLASGETTPFQAAFYANGSRTAFVVEADSLGHVKFERSRLE